MSGDTDTGADMGTGMGAAAGRDGWRVGQRAFNDLHAADPELAARIRGTDADPFYDDGRLDVFHRRVAELRADRTR